MTATITVPSDYVTARVTQIVEEPIELKQARPLQ